MEINRHSVSYIDGILYKNHLGVILTTIMPGWIIACLTNSVFVADVAAAWGVVVSAAWLWSRIGNPLEMLRFTRLGAVILSGGINASWLVASFIHRFSLNASIERSLETSMKGGLTFFYYGISIIFVNIFCIIIAFFSTNKSLLSLETNLTNRFMQLKNVQASKWLYILSIILLGEFFLIYTGIIGQRSINAEEIEKGKLPDWYILFESALAAQSIINTLLLIHLINNKKAIWRNKIILSFAIVSCLTFVYVCFTKGRSNVVFGLFCHFYWFCLFSSSRPNLRKLILYTVFIYPILSQVLLFNNYLRSGVYIDSERSSIEQLPRLWSDFQNSDVEFKEEQGRTKENLATRPLVATPLALCIQLDDAQKQFLLGKQLLHSFIWSIPGPLFPNKSDYPRQEDLLYAYFPIGQDDTADSLYLSAYTDFEWFGLLIYPGLLILFWYVTLSLIMKLQRTSIALVVTIGLYINLFTLGIGEAAVIDWIVSLRLCLVWLFTDNIVMFFIKKKRTVRYSDDAAVNLKSESYY